MSLLGKTKPLRLHRETILSMSGVGRATVPPQKKDLLTTSRAGRSYPGLMVSDAMNSVNERDGGWGTRARGIWSAARQRRFVGPDPGMRARQRHARADRGVGRTVTSEPRAPQRRR